MKRLMLVGVLLAVSSWSMASLAFASTVSMCVPRTEGAPIVTPKHGKCRKHYALTRLGVEGKRGVEGKSGVEGKAGAQGKEGNAGTTGFTSSELETLKSILPHIKYVASGVGGKPTIQFAAVNVQVVSGSGATKGVINGEGNLVIGYGENSGTHQQTGSHNLILGIEQEFTSYGGFLAGSENAVTAPYATVSGGDSNLASGEFASVSGGGAHNTASQQFASVSGGYHNTASSYFSWVGGGFENLASGPESSIFGGQTLTAAKQFEAIP